MIAFIKEKFLQFIFIGLYLTVNLSLFAQERTNPENQSEELGTVQWYRDYEQALVLAEKEKKPVLILFQEVPGCSTCRNYGHNVLSHPLIVETIENNFIPLAIYNNKGGKDKAVLEKYGEPSWNNPVVRIVDANGENLVKRIGGDYSAASLIHAIKSTLKAKTPPYVNLLDQELSAEKENARQTAYFRMYCFWSGEKHFGSINGVLATEAGFMNGAEVVKVTFDKNVIMENKLVLHAQKANCQLVEKNNSYRIATDDKYYLQKTNYKYLPLTELQKTKINSTLGKGESAVLFLSPKQLELLTKLKKINGKKQVLYNKPIAETWNLVIE